MSKMIPIDLQVEKVEEALRQYKILESKESKEQLMTSMILLMTGFQNENLDMTEVVKRANEEEGRMSLMDNILSDNIN